MYLFKLIHCGGSYGFWRYFNRVVSFGVVCVCCSLFAFSSAVNANAYSPVQGASITPRASPTPSAVGDSYRFASNDPRLSFSGSASSYPSPRGVAAKTYSPAQWRPHALKALRLSGASFALFFAGDVICSNIDCVDLVWGRDIEYQSTDVGNVFVDLNGLPNEWNLTSRRTCNSPNGSLVGFGCLSEHDRMFYEDYLANQCSSPGLSCVMIKDVNQIGTPPSHYYQYQFWIGSAFNAETCPSGFPMVGGVCQSPGNVVPFDESIFENAVAQPNVNAEADALNDALWNELNTLGVPGDIELQFDPVTESLTSTQGDTVTEIIREYNYSVQNNNTPSPVVIPSVTETTNIYEDGNLVDSEVVTEQPSSDGLPVEGLSDCQFMPTVCDFLEWFRTDDQPEENDFSELLVDDIEQEEYNFNAGSGDCPEPLEISLLFFESSVSFDYQPICDVVGILYYFVVIGASIFSFRIVYGSLA